MSLKFETSYGSPGGFVAEYEGFLGFITPDDDTSPLSYFYSIHEGGRIRLEGQSATAKEAEQEIINWINQYTSE